MEAKVIFDDNPRSGCGYIVGQRLRGKVACVNNYPKELIVEDITVSFRGYFRASASLDEASVPNALSKRQVIHEQTDFFCIGQFLSDEQRILRYLESAAFPFEFTIPRRSQHPYPEDAISMSAVHNPLQEGLPLPPSYSSTEKLGTKGTMHAVTDYNMRAVIEHDMQSTPVVVVRQVPITNFVELPNAQPQPTNLHLPVAEIRSRRLHDKSDSIANKARRLLQRSSSKPSMELQIGLQLPDNLAPGETVPLLINAITTRRGVATSQGNTLQIKSLDLGLEVLDEVSIQSQVKHRKQQIRSWSFAAKDRAEIPSDGTMAVLARHFSLPRPESVGQVAPDFNLPGFVHRHVMKVCLCVKHVESGLEFHYRKEYPFVIRPPFALLDESEDAILARKQRLALAAHGAQLTAAQRNTTAADDSVGHRSELPADITNTNDEIMCLVELPGDNSFLGTTPDPEQFGLSTAGDGVEEQEEAAGLPLPPRIIGPPTTFDVDMHGTVEIRPASGYSFSFSGSEACGSDEEDEEEEVKPTATILDLSSHYDSCDWSFAAFSPVDAEPGEVSDSVDKQDELSHSSQVTGS